MAVLAVALFARIAAADAVVLRNGSRVRGTVTMCDEEMCSVAGKRVALPDIARIELGDARAIPLSATAGSVVLANGTVRHGRFAGLNLGFVWIGDEEIERTDVSAIVLAAAAETAAQSATPSAAPEHHPAAPAGEVTTRVSERRLLLNETRLSATADAPGFVELINRGTEAVRLEGWSVRNDRDTAIALPSESEIAAGATLAIPVRADFTSARGGSVSLIREGAVVDAVAWGPRHPNAVRLCLGGRCSDPAPGSVIARLPGSGRPFSGKEWALLDPIHATPGAANPLPPVTAFACPPGQIVADRPRFSWYGVPGGESYRIQIARDAEFAAIAHEERVAATDRNALTQETLLGPRLPKGRYFWRVQAVGAGELAAPFSRVTYFVVDPEFHLETAGLARPTLVAGPPMAAAEDPIILPIDPVPQRKDTAMLMLEPVSETNPKAWDQPDPVSGRPYCARAAIVNIVHYYGGEVSQDRAGFEGFRDTRPGPELDLPETGVYDPEIKRMVRWALGTDGRYFDNPKPGRNYTGCKERNRQLGCGVTTPCPECPPEIAHPFTLPLMEHIRSELRAHRPILATYTNHVFLISGWGTRNGKEYWGYLDAGGGSWSEMTGESLEDVASYWTELTPVKLAHDEAGVRNDDDHDDVVDFDESVRFKTKPGVKDSDGDGVNDKEEIRASVFDPEYGYARTLPETESISVIEETIDPSARDKDGDGQAMENDPDSDNGGCKDGEEDLDGDGRRDPSEASNFVRADDVLNDEGKCAETWTGMVRYREWQRKGGASTEVMSEIKARFSELRTLETRDPAAMARGERGALLASTVGLTCQGTTISVVATMTTPPIRCVGSGVTTAGRNPTDDGFIHRPHVERNLTDIVGFNIPRQGFYMLGCKVPEATYPIDCSGPGATPFRMGFGFPVIGRHPTEPPATTRTDPEVRIFRENGRMAGSYSRQESLDNGGVAGTEASWSLCRRGVPCGPPPPLPSEQEQKP